jgi:hypothetical protein
MNNFTIYALDDLIFKVEVHILYGLHSAIEKMFVNTSTVLISGPARAQSIVGVPNPPVRRLSPYVSFEERYVPRKFFFGALYSLSITSVVSQPLNMPPTYKMYERGRALIMYNTTPTGTLVLDQFADVNLGTVFWTMPVPTVAETKEYLDAYFETFHEMTTTGPGQYSFAFTQLIMPYFPYFSNCFGYDSYIPIWMLLEDPVGCQLSKQMPHKYWRRKDAPMPDQDHQAFVGPFNLLGNPIADYCKRSLICNYEEDLPNAQATPRFFEASSSTKLYHIIRYPLIYEEYTGRSNTTIHADDGGGGAYATALATITTDNLIPVVVTSNSGGTSSFPRDIYFKIAYYQVDNYSKKIIYARMAMANVDASSSNTQYNLKLHYFALGYMALILNFAYPVQLFIVMFIFLGIVTVALGFGFWLVNRICTQLQNPPELKIWSMFALVVPPAAAGTNLAVILVGIYLMIGNYFINGVWLVNPQEPIVSQLGSAYFDSYQVTFNNVNGVTTVAMTAAEMAAARSGRIGLIFWCIAFSCLPQFYSSPH